MGEKDEDLVDLAFDCGGSGWTSSDQLPESASRDAAGGAAADDPKRCLKVLCMVRFANPSRTCAAPAAGKWSCARWQSLALYPCNSIFTTAT